MFQVVIGYLQRLQLVNQDEEGKQLESGQIDLVIEEDGVPLSVIIVFEGWELTRLVDSSTEGGMRIQAHFIGQYFVIFLEGSFEHDQRF